MIKPIFFVRQSLACYFLLNKIFGSLFFLYFCSRKELLGSKRMQIAEFWTIAKSLPLLRWKTRKQLILSYSAVFSVIFNKKRVDSIIPPFNNKDYVNCLPKKLCCYIFWLYGVDTAWAFLSCHFLCLNAIHRHGKYVTNDG